MILMNFTLIHFNIHRCLGYGNDKDAICDHYKRIRNKILNMYRKDPTKYLSVTECIRKLGKEIKF